MLAVLLVAGVARAQEPSAAASDRAFPTLGITLMSSGSTVALVGGAFAVAARASGHAPTPLDWSLLGVGGAAFVTGVVLAVVSLTAGHGPGEHPAFAVAPTPGGGLVAVWQLRF